MKYTYVRWESPCSLDRTSRRRYTLRTGQSFAESVGSLRLQVGRSSLPSLARIFPSPKTGSGWSRITHWRRRGVTPWQWPRRESCNFKNKSKLRIFTCKCFRFFCGSKCLQEKCKKKPEYILRLIVFKSLFFVLPWTFHGILWNETNTFRFWMLFLKR